MKRRLQARPQFDKWQLVLCCAALFSGAALVIAIELHTNLGVLLLCLGGLSAAAFAFHWRRGSPSRRRVIITGVRAGLVGGTLATLGYDVSRLLIVSLAHLKFAPFHAFPLFGALILGKGVAVWAAWTVGTMYHYLNGVAFAIAYCILLGNRNWKWAIVWALGLEALMFTIYPGWLDLRAVMTEFTVVSLSGHVVYGCILGMISQSMFRST